MSSSERQIYVSFKSQALQPALLQKQCSTMQYSMFKSDKQDRELTGRQGKDGDFGQSCRELRLPGKQARPY